MTNPTNIEQIVSIPRGTIIESDSTHLAFQSAVIAKDYIFRFNPKETRSVILDAECWNRHLAPPRGVPGKLTPLKGNISKTTDVWGKSSAPVQSTFNVSPSQDARVFTAIANLNPRLALLFLQEAIKAIDDMGIDVSDITQELMTISSSPNKQRLCGIVRSHELYNYIKAKGLREFLIKQGRPLDENINDVIQLIINVYALTSHRLVVRLYDLAIELTDLLEDRKIAVKQERKDELTHLIREKYMTILDSLPLLDEIEWEKV